MLQEATAYRGLAGSDLAGQQHKTAAAIDPIQQMRQRLAVPVAHEQIARVGRNREGRLFQSEKLGIHGCNGVSSGKASILERGRGIVLRRNH